MRIEKLSGVHEDGTIKGCVIDHERLTIAGRLVAITVWGECADSWFDNMCRAMGCTPKVWYMTGR